MYEIAINFYRSLTTSSVERGSTLTTFSATRELLTTSEEFEQRLCETSNKIFTSWRMPRTRSGELPTVELRRSYYSFTRVSPRERATPTGGPGRSGRQDRDHPDQVERDDQVDGNVRRSFTDDPRDRVRREPGGGGAAQDDCRDAAQPSGTGGAARGDGQREAHTPGAVGSAREGGHEAAQSPRDGGEGSGRGQGGTGEVPDRPEQDQQDVLLGEGDTDATLQTSPNEALLAWTSSHSIGDIIKLEYSSKYGSDAVFCIR